LFSPLFFCRFLFLHTSDSFLFKKKKKKTKKKQFGTAVMREDGKEAFQGTIETPTIKE
jgi:hypothetical protein